jgi:hypothetical protein
MSPLEPELPPVGEEIHVSPPSVLPLLMALGITLALIGITTFIELTIAGGLLALGALVRWISDTRREVDELPLD